MSNRWKWGLSIGGYILNLLAVVLIIALVNPNPLINILLSMYLLVITCVISYTLSHQKRK